MLTEQEKKVITERLQSIAILAVQAQNIDELSEQFGDLLLDIESDLSYLSNLMHKIYGREEKS